MILSLDSGWNPIFSGFRESGSWGLRGSPCAAPFGPLTRFRRTRFDSGPRFLDFSLFQKVERWTPRFRGNEAAPPPRIPRVVPQDSFSSSAAVSVALQGRGGWRQSILASVRCSQTIFSPVWCQTPSSPGGAGSPAQPTYSVARTPTPNDVMTHNLWCHAVYASHDVMQVAPIRSSPLPPFT